MKAKNIFFIIVISLLLTSCGTDNSFMIGNNIYTEYSSIGNKRESNGYEIRVYVDGEVEDIVTENEKTYVKICNKNDEFYIEFKDEETANQLIDENKGQKIRCYGILGGQIERFYSILSYEHIYLCDEQHYFAPNIKKSPDPTPTPIEKNYDNIFLKDWVRWDMDIEEVKDLENRYIDKTTSDITGQRKFLYFSPLKTDYLNFEYFYMFEHDYLKSYFVRYTGNDYFGKYNEIKELMMERYGNPIYDDVTWSDDTYKEDETKWNQAFKYGYVKMKTAWQDGNTMIVINWDYKEEIYLAYCSVNYENSL